MGSILPLPGCLLRVFIFPSWWTQSFRDLHSIHSIWVLLGLHSHSNPFPSGFHPHHSTETFSLRAPMTSKFLGQMDPLLAVSNSASEQPWTTEALHLEALPFRVFMTLHPLVFLGHSFSLSSVNSSFPIQLAPFGARSCPLLSFPFPPYILSLGDFKHLYGYKHSGHSDLLSEFLTFI